MFSALLSSRIAPSTERSASRLFGSGFSRVESTGMRGLLCVRLFFAFVPRSAREGKRGNFYSRHENFLVRSDAALCAEAPRASTGVPVHRFGNRCKTFPGSARGQCHDVYQFSRNEHPIGVVNPKPTRESLDGQNESGTGTETRV